MIGDKDTKKQLIEDFLKKFNQLEQDDVSIEDIRKDKKNEEYKKAKFTPMYKLSCKIDNQDIVLTYGKNNKGTLTYQVKYGSTTIRFYSDGYLNINGQFMNENFGDNGKNGDQAFLQEFNSINAKFQSFVDSVVNDIENTSACDLDKEYPDAKFKQHEMRRKLREDYDKTYYTDNKDGTFDVTIGKNNYQTAFIHFQPTLKKLFFDSDCSHGSYTYSDLDEDFVDELFTKNKKKSATMFAFNNATNITTQIYKIPPFSVGMMFGENNDILDYFNSDTWHDSNMVTSKVGKRYQFNASCRMGKRKETKLIKVARDALKDENLSKTDKYKLLFSQIEHRWKRNIYYNGGENSYDKDFYFSGDEAIMLTNENNSKFDVKNFCIQMNFSDNDDISQPNELFCRINNHQPTIKWNESFKYEGGEFPNGIEPEVAEIVKQNAKLGNTHIWILDYGNAPYTMIKVKNSVDAVREYFNFRYEQVEAERKSGKIIHKPFRLKEEQDGKKIDNENDSKIENPQINNCSNISNLQSKESKINNPKDNISNLQSFNQRTEIPARNIPIIPSMLNKQQTQNNRHPLNDVCGHNLSWLDCCNLCGQQVINGK